MFLFLFLVFFKNDGIVLETERISSCIHSKCRFSLDLGFFPDLKKKKHILNNRISPLWPCKGIQDSLGIWISCRGIRIPTTGLKSFSVKLGFWIPVISVSPDSLSCIPDSEAQDSQFHN